jgi:hypothetical protein
MGETSNLLTSKHVVHIETTAPQRFNDRTGYVRIEEAKI